MFSEEQYYREIESLNHNLNECAKLERNKRTIAFFKRYDKELTKMYKLLGQHISPHLRGANDKFKEGYYAYAEWKRRNTTTLQGMRKHSA